MEQIDHNPHERRPTMRIWWAAWIMVALLWIAGLTMFDLDWFSICLGAVTAGVLASWATDLTGNKFMG